MVGPISHTPTVPGVVRFQPDPGEPAVSVTATPRNTAYLVTAQEQRNETRLRGQALARGEDILYSNRTFTYGYADGSPIYSGGLTTVVSREGQGNPLAKPNAESLRDQRDEQGVEVDSEEGQETGSLESLNAQEQTDEADLEEDRQDLRIQRERVTNRKEEAENEADRAARDADPLDLRTAERRISELDRREREIRREERKVELEQFEKRLEETQKTMLNAIEDNVGVAAGVLGVLYGEQQDSEPSSAGRRLDLMA